MTSGGAIPENADYRVVLDPDELFIGTLNEDFAIESNAGDIFQLGNRSWRILQVRPGVVRVADAHGAPPTLPFWLGEAPARSAELSAAVSDLRREHRSNRLGRTRTRGAGLEWLTRKPAWTRQRPSRSWPTCAESRRMLGALPTADTIVLERFFDESGGMQLVLHAPFGSRVNRAWALALRKRFCRQFNFELQAAATEDALLLSLGPQHSFPLADVFRYLHPHRPRRPDPGVSGRAGVSDALAMERHHLARGPAESRRQEGAGAVAADAGRRPAGRGVPRRGGVPREHPGRSADPGPPAGQPDGSRLPRGGDGPCRRSSRSCSGFTRERFGCVSRDTPEPSPLSHEILNARPYAFLDDAPLEERRTQAVYGEARHRPATHGGLGALDAERD